MRLITPYISFVAVFNDRSLKSLVRKGVFNILTAIVAFLSAVRFDLKVGNIINTHLALIFFLEKHGCLLFQDVDALYDTYLAFLCHNL